MAIAQRFEDLQSWQKARVLAAEIHRFSESGAFGNDFTTRNLLCRAAVSCMTEIAEGFGTFDRPSFAAHLDKARGHATETQSLLYVSLDNGYLSEEEFERLYQLAKETIALITGFIKHLRR